LAYATITQRHQRTTENHVLAKNLEAKDVLPNTNHTQAIKRAEKCSFLSLVTLIFKFHRARDQTRLPCEFGPLLHAKFHPHRCNMSPLPGEKPQNRPLSNE